MRGFVVKLSALLLLAAPILGSAFAHPVVLQTQEELLQLRSSTPVPVDLDEDVEALMEEPADPGTPMYYMQEYVMTHPYRLAAVPPMMDAARDDLEAYLDSFGLDTERHDYSFTGTNIIGYQWGSTDPDQWVVLSAHYDTVESTVFGAWDDGTGISVLLALANELSSESFPFTIVYLFTDEEEQGLIGSENFVEDYADQADIVANINTDPPGLNWPCADHNGRPYPVKIIHNQGRIADGHARSQWLYDAVEDGLDGAGVPVGVRDYARFLPVLTLNGGGLGGTSDHASFDDADIANVFIGGFPSTAARLSEPIVLPNPTDDGTITVNGLVVDALAYPLHTPLDDLRFMHTFCPFVLEESIDVIWHTIGGTLDALAAEPIPAA